MRRPKPRPLRRARRAARPGIVLEIPSGTEFLALVREVSKRVARLAGFPEQAAESVALAVDECTTNVIEHAYKGAPDGRIELRLEYRGPALRIEVRDSGDAVDQRAMPNVDLERYAAERRTGGLGVHLMEKIMDSVTFERSARRNVCCMVKRKAAGRASH